MVIFETALPSTVEGTINWAGLPWWAWLLIFLLVVLFLWWRLAVSSKEMEMEAQELSGHGDQHGHHQPDEQDAGELSTGEPAEGEDDRTEGGLEPGADDLTVIEGIGPRVSELLAGAGIKRYAQLAIADQRQLKEIVDRAGLRMIDTSSWPDQAQLAMQGKWDELDVLKDQLHGGREKDQEQE